MNKKVKFNVLGMSCMGCVAKIQKAVEEFRGDREMTVDVDLKEGLVYLSYKSEDGIKAQELKQIIDGLGFRVESITIS